MYILKKSIRFLPNTCSLLGGNENGGLEVDIEEGGIGVVIGATLSPPERMLVLRGFGFGFGGRAGCIPAPPAPLGGRTGWDPLPPSLTPDRFAAGCIVWGSTG